MDSVPLEMGSSERSGVGATKSWSQPDPFSCHSQDELLSPEIVESFSQPVLCTQATAFPHLRTTRFYSNSPLQHLMDRLCNSLKHFGVTFTLVGENKISLQTNDKRKCLLSGAIKAKTLQPHGILVVFMRKKGDPIQFKQLFVFVQTALKDIIIASPSPSGLQPLGK